MTGNGNEPDTTHASVGQFDDIDETILSMLEKDGRATLSQLSDATGLSISAVQSRVQKLERRNVILGYKAVIDDEKRGLAYVPTLRSRRSIIPRKPRFPPNCRISKASCHAIPWLGHPVTC